MRYLWTLLLASAAWGGPQWGGELRFSIYADPKTFHPLLAAEQAAGTVRYLTGGVLLRLNHATLRLEPELARAWRLSPNGRELRFEMREGLKFSDGTPLTAADVAFTLRTLLDPALHAPDADAFEPPGQKIDIQVLGNSVVLSLAVPIAGVERLFASIPVIHRRTLETLDNPAAMPVAGPFRVVEYRPGVRIVLQRNPFYSKTAGGRRLPYLDGIRLDIQQNRALELSRFLAGDLDLINNVDADSFARLQGRAEVSVADAGPSLDSEQLWFNQRPGAPIPAHKKAWFAAREFRRAVSAAVNRQDICRLVYHGRAVPAAGVVPLSNRTWANPRLAPPAFDPEGARRSLAAAGFRFRDGQLFDAGGQLVEFSIVTNAGNASRERIAALIQQDLARIGVRVRVVTLDFRSLIERLTRTFAYEACLLGLVNLDLDPNGQANVWLSSGAQHQWNPSQEKPATAWEAEIDRLMRVVTSEMRPERRKAAFDRVQEIVWDQAPFLYLVTKNALTAHRAALGNAAPSPFYPQVFWNADQLYLAEAGR